jgi:hypothetical protein
MTCRARTRGHTSGAVNAPSEYAAIVTGVLSPMARSLMALTTTSA